MAKTNSLPYIVSPGVITKVLEKIAHAATPDRFAHDFLQNTLGMKGGSSSPIIPFLKRIGFLAGDGTPTEVYKQFRNSSKAKAAVAEAMRTGYKTLFDMNEKVYTLKNDELKDLIVQATGQERKSRVVELIIGSFNALKANAKFDEKLNIDLPVEEKSEDTSSDIREGIGMSLSYTINLNLPPSTDINVFHAIFKSLKEHLLKK